MPAISFVGSASGSANSTSSFQLSKPTGVVSGDFMVAVVGFFATTDGSERTVTPPSGWTVVDGEYVTASGKPHQICVMRRTAGSSEPSTWNGSISSSSVAGLVTIVSAYRNVIGIAASGTSSKGGGTTYDTATVNNPVSANWRVTVGGYTSGTLNYEISSTEVRERKIQGRTSSLEDVQLGVWDSNGTISTGNTSRKITRGATWASSCSWIGILDANDVTITGSLEGTLPKPSMTTTAALSYSGTLAATLPKPTVTAAGIATPPDGPLDVLILPVVAIAGAHHASGTLDVLIVPVMDAEGETRKFGIRVVTPEAESRVTTPRLGAVD